VVRKQERQGQIHLSFIHQIFIDHALCVKPSLRCNRSILTHFVFLEPTLKDGEKQLSRKEMKTKMSGN
jgi:hypothetical protein